VHPGKRLPRNFRSAVALHDEDGAVAMQMTSFLQTAIVFLLLTNMISALVAFYAMKSVQVEAQPKRSAALERKLQMLLGRN
jgi:hypothetical protein